MTASGGRNGRQPSPGEPLTITKLKARLLAAKRPDGSKLPAYIVAAECGISPGELTKYSTGKVAIPARHLETMARYFGVDPNELVGTYEFEFRD